MEYRFNVSKKDNKKRLDVFLSENSKLSRSQIAKHSKHIFINDKAAKHSQKIKEGDVVTFVLIKAESKKGVAENIPIDIIYEDKDIAVVNKEAGLVVHPSREGESKTLVNALLYHLKDMRFTGDEERAGIVHRLDKDTSGLLVVGKSPEIVSALQEQFKERSVSKIYRAISKGVVKEDEGVIEKAIGRHKVYRKKMCVRADGKMAISEYKVLKRFKENTYLELQIKTGRTHQIRVHLSHMKHPILGDVIYSKSANKYEGLMLFARELRFRHPKNQKEMTFTINAPTHFEKLLNKLKNEEH